MEGDGSMTNTAKGKGPSGLGFVSAAALLLAMLVVLPGTGCRRASDEQALIFARGSDAHRLDPADIDDTESVNSLAPVLEGLVRFRPGTLEVEPWLAERWELSADGREYTFTLREGVTFHDGTPLNAETARFSFARQLEPDHPARYPDSTFPYWSTLFGEVIAVEATGPRTLVFRLSEPNATLLPSLATFPAWLISPRAASAAGHDPRRHPVGTGPFQFESWHPPQAMLFRRFDGYWGEPAAAARLVMRVIPDNTARLVELRSGRIDGMEGLQPAELAGVDKDPRFTVYRAPALNLGYLAISAKAERWRDPALRRALAQAIDREAIVHLALAGAGVAAEWPLPPGLVPPPAGASPPRFDRAAARAVLAGHPALAGAPVTLHTFNDSKPYFPDPARIASLLRHDLEAAGLTVRVVVRDFAGHLDDLRHGRYELGLLGWIGDLADADNFLTPLLAGWAAREGSATNVAFYQNPAVDDALRLGRRTSDPAARIAAYQQVLSHWARDLPLLPLVHAEQLVIWRADISGYVLDPTGVHFFGPVVRRR